MNKIKNMKKPQKLNVGDTIAIVSPSWGGPSIFPHIYENGIQVLKHLGYKIKELKNYYKNVLVSEYTVKKL